MYSKNAEANFGEKMSAKLEYFIKIEIGALFATNVAICALEKR